MQRRTRAVLDQGRRMMSLGSRSALHLARPNYGLTWMRLRACKLLLTTIVCSYHRITSATFETVRETLASCCCEIMKAGQPNMSSIKAVCRKAARVVHVSTHEREDSQSG